MNPWTFIAALLAAGSLGSAHANLLTNGSFDQGTFTGGSFGFPLAQRLFPGDTTMPGWTVVNAELAWFKSGQASITTQDGDFALDLTGFCDLGLACGAPGTYGGVTQTVSTIVGATYKLSFQAGTYLFNASIPSIVATAGSTSQTFVLPSTSSASGVWQALDMSFVATSASTVIRFGGSGGTVNPSASLTPYLGLDNASLDLVSLPIPEPGSWALMLAGLASLGFVARRRSHAAR